jgi:hypothetical protein
MATNTLQRMPGGPAERHPTASAAKLAKKTESLPQTPNTATPQPSMDFLDNLTTYAGDLGELYGKFTGNKTAAPAAPLAGPKSAASALAADKNIWLWIGGGLVAVFILAAVLFKK